MIEMTFEEATVEALAEAAVIMAVGVGDRHMSNVLLGRKEFARVAGNPALVAETKILRVKVEGEEQFEELKGRVKEAKGRLDPGVKIADVPIKKVKEEVVKEAEIAAAETKEADVKTANVRKSGGRRAKAEPQPEPEPEDGDE